MIATVDELHPIGLDASICRDSYRDFVDEFWDCVPGAGKFVPNWHIDVFCSELQIIAKRVFKKQLRLYDAVFNVPFGTSKSTVISILFQGWVWSNMPQARFLCATHTDNLGLDLAGKAKDVVTSDKYQDYFPYVRIRRDRAAKNDYATTLGGERKSCTVGGKTPTGRHAHFIIIDDPLDPQGARSEAELETSAKFMTEVIPSRMVDKEVTPTILVMQRLHHRDPTAVMLEVSKREGATPVRHVCLPGELAEGSAAVSPPELERCYRNGLMDPERLSRTVLDGYKAKLGTYAYAGQIRQNPVPRGGGMFKPQWFTNRVRSAPRDCIRIRYVDRAATQNGGCATAMVLIAKDSEGFLYVEDVVRGHWEPNERNDRIVAVAKRDRARYGPKHEPTIYIEAERGSTGLESFQRIAARLLGYKVKEDMPSGSKDVRAEPWADQLAAGNVRICDNGQQAGTGTSTWDVERFVEEHILFRPEVGKRLGEFKDQVDAAAGCCNLLANMKEVGALKIYSFRTDGKQKFPRLVVCSVDSLPLLDIVQPSLLIHFTDFGVPTPSQPPANALDARLDALTLSFADINPADYQESWTTLVQPYNKLPEELLFSRDHGKSLWRFLTKQRTPAPEIYVLVDDGPDNRTAGSIARGIADVLRIPRNTIYFADYPDEVKRGEESPPNSYLYDMVKSTRGMVI